MNVVLNNRLSHEERTIKRLAQQLMKAVAYLHAKGVGHRDISLENILLSKKQDPLTGQAEHIVLMDFDQAVRTHSPCGRVALRYYGTAGKFPYRCIEGYVPRRAENVLVRCPAHGRPGDVVLCDLWTACKEITGYVCEVRLPADAKPNKFTLAELWGYAVVPFDIYMAGACLFMLLGRGCPLPRGFGPGWLRERGGLALLLMQPDGHGIMRNLRETRKNMQLPDLPDEAINLVARMMSVQPTLRPSARECLDDVWFNK